MGKLVHIFILKLPNKKNVLILRSFAPPVLLSNSCHNVPVRPPNNSSPTPPTSCVKTLRRAMILTGVFQLNLLFIYLMFNLHGIHIFALVLLNRHHIAFSVPVDWSWFQVKLVGM